MLAMNVSVNDDLLPITACFLALSGSCQVRNEGGYSFECCLTFLASNPRCSTPSRYAASLHDQNLTNWPHVPAVVQWLCPLECSSSALRKDTRYSYGFTWFPIGSSWGTKVDRRSYFFSLLCSNSRFSNPYGWPPMRTSCTLYIFLYAVSQLEGTAAGSKCAMMRH